jgi:hypothetical protein
MGTAQVRWIIFSAVNISVEHQMTEESTVDAIQMTWRYALMQLKSGQMQACQITFSVVNSGVEHQMTEFAIQMTWRYQCLITAVFSVVCSSVEHRMTEESTVDAM